MGTIYSSLSVLSIALIAGGIIYGFLEKRPPPPDWAGPSNRAVLPGQEQPVSSETKGKKKKKAVAKEGGVQPASQPEVEPTVVQFPAIVPGSFEQAAEQTVSAATSKPKKKKKAKKTAAGASQIPLDAQSDSSATAPESPTPVPRPIATRRKSTPIIDTDGPWTRVESKKRGVHPLQSAASAAASSSATAEPAASEVTTSVTDTSSPVNERTEDEQALGTADNRRTLAERLLPKPRKTHVEDMLETPDVPPAARVMRVQPRPDEQPAAGFSWADYEDVDGSGVTADDADGEYESGWIVQSSRGRSRPKAPQSTQSAPESLTKKQRQNLAKSEASKAAKAEAEAQRQATLAKHKRELEKARMAEQFTQQGKKKSGGMRASVDSEGHMVFE
ncbi:uncharacterized protein PHACADRAFT_264760 [Phanerochaete carnosa HHB-10118-sp]|uniref:Uncharacterized protein n=1 Tax=Phanerochaete carnosa (strain HHB-10118-sp) TaxID=650164 RepID=K5VG44_PHACS|nr:uncharacterized protein PHACADRAFT_264760 [Phanerochaete carnosa HHB-10118-sp]EKM50178.1 hypothetical protein PHACADRAFT_264760 [Phanerochaete carnosa HHB-10118-sp]